MITANKVISTILKHDAKVTSYKIALLRAINDVVLSFPDLRNYNKPVAIPLRVLAEFWVAYYWPFVSPNKSILQGPRQVARGALRNDMAFRPYATAFYSEWAKLCVGVPKPSDGFFIINELRVPRKRASYPKQLLDAYNQTIKAISKTIEMPIRYAGPKGEQWTIFNKPARYAQLEGQVVPVPGTQSYDLCLTIHPELWQAFRQMSLWVEALCIHEWCLFTEKVMQEDGGFIDRGVVYRLLTDRPDNRRPLTWERNNIDLLILDGKEFICPWTERRINHLIEYDIDHILPVSVYPTNELWNLVPSDPQFNSQVKRDRLPSIDRLHRAEPHLILTYSHYLSSDHLASAIYEDAVIRFSNLRVDNLAQTIASAVIDFVHQTADSRNLAVFE